MTYHFRLIAELGWIAVTTAIVTLASAIGSVSFDDFLADPVKTALALGVIAGRAALAAVIAKLNGSFSLR